MKKKIFTIITLLIAFFGLLGITPANQVLAAGDQTTVDKDLAAIVVSDTAIVSFPVTYKSAYGNTITWSVEEGQTAIEYDADARWMVVNRSATVDQEADITVTITGEGEASATKTFTVKVPKGVTAVPTYTISYNLNGGSLEEGTVLQESYELGEASFTLPTPVLAGYTFLGWDNGKKVVTKHLVGSMSNITYTAKWDKILTPLADGDVALNVTNFTYNGQPQTPIVTVTKGEKTLTLDTDYTVEFSADVTNVGTKEVKVTGMGDYSGVITKEFNIAKKELTLTPTTKPMTYGVALPTWTIADLTADGLVDGENLSDVIKEEVSYVFKQDGQVVENPSQAGTYGIAFNPLTADNYDVIVEDSELTIAKKDLTLTPADKAINYGVVLPTWKLADVTAAGLIATDDLATVLGLAAEDAFTVSYSQDGASVTTPTEAGTYVVTFEAVEATNYNVIFETAKLIISDADIILTVIDSSFEYDRTGHELVLEARNKAGELLEGGTYSYHDGGAGYSAYRKTEAGTYNLTVTYTHPTYGTTSIITALVITPRVIELTANNASAKYGEDPVVTNEDYEVTNGTIVEADLAPLAITVKVEDGKTVVNYIENTNYVITTVDGTVTYTARQIEVTADAKSSDYSQELVELTYKLTGDEVLEGDEELVASLIAITTDATIASPVGTYTITITTTNNEKYEFTVVNGVYTINQLDASAAIITLDGSDYNIKANTVEPTFTVKLGETTLTVDDYDFAYDGNDQVGTATLTVTFKGNYKGEATVEFNVTQNGQAEVDAAIIAEKYAGLTGELKTIPAKLDTVADGSVVIWNSDNTALAIAADGTTTVTLNGQDQEIVLTAEVRYGTTSTSYVQFEFKLAPVKNITEALASADGTEVVLTGTVKSVDGAWNTQYNNMNVTIEDEAGNTIYVYRLATKVEAGSVIKLSGEMGTYNGSRQVAQGATAEIISGPTDEYKLVADKESLTLEATVTSDFELPATGTNGSTITWSVIAGDAITIEEGVAKVTRGSEDATVKLEATLTLGELESVTKEFTITIPALPAEGTPVYELVTDASTLTAGDQIIIVASGSNYALSTTQNKNNRGQVEIIKVDNTISLDDNSTVQLITVESGTETDTFALNVGNGYLYAAGGTATNNYLRTTETLNITSSWTISINATGEAVIKSADTTVVRNTLKYNASSDVFACYASGQASVSIYRLVD